jgi:chromate reductase
VHRDSGFSSPGSNRRTGNGTAGCSALLPVRVSLLLISGSLRWASTNTALLLTAARHTPPAVTCLLYDGLASLPPFNPDEDRTPLHSAVERLRRHIHQADGILFSVPEYAGALPGAFKNLLDWTIGDPDSRSIYEKPVGWLNASPRGAKAAHDELRTVLTYAHARIIDSACLHQPVTAQMIATDGLIAGVDYEQLTAAVDALASASLSVPAETQEP